MNVFLRVVSARGLRLTMLDVGDTVDCVVEQYNGPMKSDSVTFSALMYAAGVEGYKVVEQEAP